MLARKKSSRYIRYKFTLKNWKNFNFTLNYAEDYAAAEKWQKTFIFILIMKIILSVNMAQW